MSAPCEFNVDLLWSQCRPPVISMSAPCDLNVGLLWSQCRHPVISMSPSCDLNVGLLWSQCRHPVISMLAPWYLNLGTLSSHYWPHWSHCDNSEASGFFLWGGWGKERQAKSGQFFGPRNLSRAKRRKSGARSPNKFGKINPLKPLKWQIFA